MSSDKPHLVIISGPPAAGKSSIARPLAEALGYPLFCMDEIKEHLADAIGPDSGNFADLLGVAAVNETLFIANELLTQNVSIVVEGFFQSDRYSNAFSELATQSKMVLVHIRADDATLKHRYERRALARERHWIHDDLGNLPGLKPELPEFMARQLELDIPRIVIDTTFGPIDVAEVAFMIRELMTK